MCRSLVVYVREERFLITFNVIWVHNLAGWCKGNISGSAPGAIGSTPIPASIKG